MLRKCFIRIIRFYQKFISPLFPSCCRFYPSCSKYGIEAIETHGACKGVCLTLRRLMKCQPFHKGGIDLVPPRKK